MEERFLEFVAEVMEVDTSEISMETTYKEYMKWDSLMMLTLIMELEQEYGVLIPVESINSVRQLRDLYRMVDQAGC